MPSPLIVYHTRSTKPIRNKIHTYERIQISIPIDAPCNLLLDPLGSTMDTAAYLASQGWAGQGHALHHSGRGIIKPIAVTQKNNVLGVGKKRHDAHADQWWARAFDETLKGINAAKDGATGTTEGLVVTGAAKQAGSKMRGGVNGVGNGLYSCFVKGEGLGGTLEAQDVELGMHIGESSLRKHEAKKRKKKRVPEQSEGPEMASLRRYRDDDGAEENVRAVNAVPKEEKKEKRKKRKGVDTTIEGQEAPKAELIEKEQRKQRKKARKEENAGLAIDS